MKILFSNPPWWHLESKNDPASGTMTAHLRQGIRAGSRWPFTRPAAHKPDQYQFGGYLPFPFFLAHAASYTARELPSATVTLRDSIARGESYATFLDYLANQTPDWLVIETASPSWEHDARLLSIVAQKFPAIRIILCGPIDAAKHKEIFQGNRAIAAIVQGEYDKRIAVAITGYVAGGAPRVLHHDLLTVEEMNASPLPMWDEACAAHYWDACPVGHEPAQLQLWTSRGCPHKCAFCVWPATMTGFDPDGSRSRSVRCYSPEYIERLLVDRLRRGVESGTPFRSIYDDSDTMNLVNKHTIAMCAVYKKIGLPWSAMCRADSSSREVWQIMKDSGCFGVKIGFESASQRVINEIINKKLDIAKAVETCKWLRSIGLTVHTTWSIGHPGETKEEQQQTRDLIRAMYENGAHDTHQLSGTATIEGTPLAAIAEGKHLAKYPGASLEGFVINSDGQKKAEDMRT